MKHLPHAPSACQKARLRGEPKPYFRCAICGRTSAFKSGRKVICDGLRLTITKGG